MCRPLVITILLTLAASARAEVPADWAFKPVRPRAVPKLAARTPIDSFLLERLHAVKLDYAPAADRATLLRRVTFDLVGRPPTPGDLDAFLADDRPDAFERVVERLLSSTGYGERQALPWLDVVRFAETDGFKADDKRPHAWRYRDYVIRSFNADKPFDQFVREQLAGDELFMNEPEALIATAFLRHYPDEYNAVNLEQRRQEILNDITDTTAQTFLGLTVGCAKCHDHKYDPVTQEDYYRLQAFFAGWNEVDAPLMSPGERAEFDRRLATWESKTADVRKALDVLERPFRDGFSKKRRGRFPEEYAKLLDVPEEKRTPLERQIAAMVAKQVYADDKGMFSGMKPTEKERHESLKKQLADAGPRPTPSAVAMAFTDVGRVVPPTHVLKRGNWAKKGDEVEAGFLSAIDDHAARPTLTGRRSALANWIADSNNPLTARVFVNRVWQQHFGKGLVVSSGDLGAQGDRPSHPELLDWLAADFMVHGWSVKHLHRRIVLSDAYQQGSMSTAGSRIDPENKLLWRMNRRRLDGESLRDAILAIGDSLNDRASGPSVYPELPPELKAGAWPVSADVAERNRRSIYVFVKRNLRYPLFAAFDAPDRTETCSRRYETTTAPQALMLLNDALVIEKAKRFATRIEREAGSDPDARVERAYRIALSRLPTSEERSAARTFLASGHLADLCHAILNLNEFAYVD